MFRLREQRGDHYEQIVIHYQGLQRTLFTRIHPEFVKRHGHILGGVLAQATVDKIFARPSVLNQSIRILAEQFASEIALKDQAVRLAAFHSLHKMLERERANRNDRAGQRIQETIQWLEQFGEMDVDRSQVPTRPIIGEPSSVVTSLTEKRHGSNEKRVSTMIRWPLVRIWSWCFLALRALFGVGRLSEVDSYYGHYESNEHSQ